MSPLKMTAKRRFLSERSKSLHINRKGINFRIKVEPQTSWCAFCSCRKAFPIPAFPSSSLISHYVEADTHPHT